MEVTPDGLRLAQLLTCRDPAARSARRYVLITAPDGGIPNDPVALRLEENTFWFALADSDALPYAKGLAAYADGRALLEAEAYPLQTQGSVEGRRGPCSATTSSTRYTTSAVSTWTASRSS